MYDIEFGIEKKLYIYIYAIAKFFLSTFHLIHQYYKLKRIDRKIVAKSEKPRAEFSGE